MTGGSASKQKGSRLEREAAAVLGGRRMVLSGAVGGGDIAIPSDSIFADFSFEAKSRKKLPDYFTKAMRQCEYECRGTAKRPAIIVKEDHGRIMVNLYLDDFVQWGRALAELGNGAKAKALVRDAKRVLDELERSVS